MPGLVSARAARRIVTAAAVGGGGLGVLGATVYGLLRTQAFVARRSITGRPVADPPEADGVYGGASGPPLSFVLLGDSTAAGYGVDSAEETPGALLAAGLAELAERPVQLTTAARGGSLSADLAGQVDKALAAEPDVALVIIGGNDVTHKVKPAESVRYLDSAVRRLRAHGAAVVVGTCPDLGTIKPLQPSLRWLARRWSRQLAAAQTVAVVEAGGRTISLGPILGPEFEAAPGVLFADDQFHPSAAGYAHAAAAMLPSLAGALGIWDGEDHPDPTRGDEVLPVSVAAAAAADDSGAEVARVRVGSSERGPRGVWAQVRHREPVAPADYDGDDDTTTVGVTRE